MKNILFSTFFLLSFIGTSQTATWSPLNSNTSSALISVYAKSDSVCYVCGVGGIIKRTLDGGNSWNSVTSGVSSSLYAIQFTNNQIGYVAGDNSTVIRTDNGGTNWNSLTVTSSSIDFRDIHFPTTSTGYVAGGTSGSTGHMFKTTNGGATWTSVSLPSGTKSIYAVKFRDSQIGYISTLDGKIYKTTNGGSSWTSKTIHNTFIPDIDFVSNSTLISVGYNEFVSRSSNNGTSWSPVTVVTPNQELNHIEFIDSTHGFIVGGNFSTYTTGVILSTTNGGLQWSALYPAKCNSLSSVHFSSPQVGYAVGYYGTIMKYTKSTPTTSIIEKKESFDFQVFPNPFTEHIQISVDNNIKIKNIVLTNSIGQTVLNKNYSESKIKVDLSKLTKGIYFAKITSANNQSLIKKIIKQ